MRMFEWLFKKRQKGANFNSVDKEVIKKGILSIRNKAVNTE